MDKLLKFGKSKIYVFACTANKSFVYGWLHLVRVHLLVLY